LRSKKKTDEKLLFDSVLHRYVHDSHWSQSPKQFRRVRCRVKINRCWGWAPHGKRSTKKAGGRVSAPPWALRLSMLLKISTTTLHRCSVSAIMSYNKSSTRGLLAYVYGGCASARELMHLCLNFQVGIGCRIVYLPRVSYPLFG